MAAANPAAVTASPRQKNTRTGLVLLSVVIGMLVLSFAAVPFYRLFCSRTGYNGTTQRATAAPAQILARIVTVGFSGNVASGMPWRFAPNQHQIEVHLGQKVMVTFTATNQTDATITGQATYNVTPSKAGLYFKKIQCFCFNEQVLKPHQTVIMPVLFFVDPAMAQDRALDDVKYITLSYTFFREN